MTSLKNLLKTICVLNVLLFLFNNNSVGQTNALELKAERLSDKIVSLDDYNSLSATQHELSFHFFLMYLTTNIVICSESVIGCRIMNIYFCNNCDRFLYTSE